MSHNSSCNDRDGLHSKGYVADSYDVAGCSGNISATVTTPTVTNPADCVAGQVCYDIGHIQGVASVNAVGVTPTMLDCVTGNQCYDQGYSQGLASAYVPLQGDCVTGNACYDSGYAAGNAAGTTNISGLVTYVLQNQVAIGGSGWSPGDKCTGSNSNTIYEYIGLNNGTPSNPEIIIFRADGTEVTRQWRNVRLSITYEGNSSTHSKTFGEDSLLSTIRNLFASALGTQISYVVSHTNYSSTVNAIQAYGASVLGSTPNGSTITTHLIGLQALANNTAAITAGITNNPQGNNANGIGDVVVLNTDPYDPNVSSITSIATMLTDSVANIKAVNPNVHIVLATPYNVTPAFAAKVRGAYDDAAKTLNLPLIDTNALMVDPELDNSKYVIGNGLTELGQARTLLYILNEIVLESYKSNLTYPKQVVSIVGATSIVSYPRITADNILRTHLAFDRNGIGATAITSRTVINEASGTSSYDADMTACYMRGTGGTFDKLYVLPHTGRVICHLDASLNFLGAVTLTDGQAAGLEAVPATAYALNIDQTKHNLVAPSASTADKRLGHQVMVTPLVRGTANNLPIAPQYWLSIAGAQASTSAWSTAIIDGVAGDVYRLDNPNGNVHSVRFFDSLGAATSITSMPAIAGVSYREFTIPVGSYYFSVELSSAGAGFTMLDRLAVKLYQTPIVSLSGGTTTLTGIDGALAVQGLYITLNEAA